MEENTKRINDVYDYLLYRHIIKGQEDMAIALKTSRPNITAMLNGKKNVSTETLRKISDAFPGIFTLNWLITGQFPMFLDSPYEEEKSKTEQSVDKSSLINAALAAKDETIASKEEIISNLKHQIAEKDDHIATLKARIADLQATISSLRSSDRSAYPFPVGTAEDKQIRTKV